MHFKVKPGGVIQGKARVPGDKSISHRAIMLGALAEGTTRISGFLEGEDALATLGAFRAMGVSVEGPEDGQVVVHGVGLHGLKAPAVPLDLGNAGTGMRLMCGLLAGQAFDAELTGDASLRSRPMGRVIDPLTKMGAVIASADEGRPPLKVSGGARLQGIHYDLPMASAQVKSCLLLAGLYAIYMLAIGWFRPDMAPAIPAEERDAMSRQELIRKLFFVVLPPIFLIFAVLGSIIGGIAAPTEAASMGGIGSILIAYLGKRLTKKVVIETVQGTLRISAMVFFILIAAQAFSLAFRGLNGDELIEMLFQFVPGGVTSDIIFVLLMLFLLGFFLEWIEICYIVLPLFWPILDKSGVDPVWFAILAGVNLQTSFLTPPVGWALFFLKGVAPPEVTSKDIYVGVMPFVALQLVGLVLLFLYPSIATWLPKAIGW